MTSRETHAFPRVLAACLVALAVFAAWTAWRADDPAPAQGFVRTEHEFAGDLAANETVVHPFTVVLPLEAAGEGLTFTADHAVASIAPIDQNDDAFRLVLTSHHGDTLLDKVIDPQDGGTWLHGPTFLDLPAGAYELAISPAADGPASYGLELSLAVPVSARPEGVVVGHLAVWGPALAAGALALLALVWLTPFPAWVRAKVFRPPEGSPPQREAEQE